MSLKLFIKESLEAECDRWVLWAPVLFATGIAIYFSYGQEPSLYLGPIASIFSVCGAYIFRQRDWVLIPLVACTIFWAGFSVVKIRSDAVSAPVLTKPVGPNKLQGRILRIEFFPKRPRLLLDQVRLDSRYSQVVLPNRVLVRLNHPIHFAVGAQVSVPVRLMPLPGPVSPGAFDFQRKSWFEKIGAIGYAVGPVRAAKQGSDSTDTLPLFVHIDRFRNQLAAHLDTILPKPESALVIALITGDRSRIPAGVTEALRDAGLAHLLAISGLHIGLMASLVYGTVRLFLATVQPIALRVDVKKYAAISALFASFVYLLISGASLPTQRAFIMGGMMLCAVLFGREAISLRLVACAAMIILIFRPESLLSASFQMSFAAVIGLVAFYEAWSPHFRRIFATPLTLRRRILVYFLSLIATTVVAGAATGLIAYYHFGRITHYGLIANLLAVPLTALWIMPMAVLGCLLLPFGLEALPLELMAIGVSAVMKIANEVSALPGAVTLHPQLPLFSFVACILGSLWLCLMRSKWRWAGLSLILVGISAIPLQPRPDILIDGDGKLVAVRLPEGRLSLSETNKKRFTSSKWLQLDGQNQVLHWTAAGPAVRCDSASCLYAKDNHRIAFVRHPSALVEDCLRAQLIVVFSWRRNTCIDASKPTITLRDLRENGAHAIYLKRGIIEVVAANELRGKRPWSAPITSSP